ncbi:hypothetical protein V5O48_016320 [Marasmius crinis-equi]|uniref:Fe2OG dioxygenase domain-containing protein n=1 Tax=Marasmius crinis-equi TaxID=585013 RepID=A0ABR3ES40_9AGAR
MSLTLSVHLLTLHILLFLPSVSYADGICSPDIITRLKNTGAFKDAPHGSPNHIILNEYLPGQGIMPHEDGPAYHPAVATISLGSHAIFHYYQYKTDDETEPEDGALRRQTADAENSHNPLRASEGRAVDPTPVLTVLLEPRSVVITTGEFYRSHLHGISEVSEDLLIPGGTDDMAPHVVVPMRVELGAGAAETRLPIANWKLVSGDNYRAGGCLKRGTRHSLTCRDVVRVSRATPAASFILR